MTTNTILINHSRIRRGWVIGRGKLSYRVSVQSGVVVEVQGTLACVYSGQAELKGTVTTTLRELLSRHTPSPHLVLTSRVASPCLCPPHLSYHFTSPHVKNIDSLYTAGCEEIRCLDNLPFFPQQPKQPSLSLPHSWPPMHSLFHIISLRIYFLQRVKIYA